MSEDSAITSATKAREDPTRQATSALGTGSSGDDQGIQVSTTRMSVPELRDHCRRTYGDNTSQLRVELKFDTEALWDDPDYIPLQKDCGQGDEDHWDFCGVKTEPDQKDSGECAEDHWDFCGVKTEPDQKDSGECAEDHWDYCEEETEPEVERWRHFHWYMVTVHPEIVISGQGSAGKTLSQTVTVRNDFYPALGSVLEETYDDLLDGIAPGRWKGEGCSTADLARRVPESFRDWLNRSAAHVITGPPPDPRLRPKLTWTRYDGNPFGRGDTCINFYYEACRECHKT